jgi:hypothetical protein
MMEPDFRAALIAGEQPTPKRADREMTETRQGAAGGALTSPAAM